MYAPTFRLAALALSASPLLAQAQAEGYDRRAVLMIGGSVVMLGSQERRVVFGAALQASRPEKRFAFAGLPPRIVYEASYAYSNGSRKRRPRNSYHTVDVLAMGRWELSRTGRARAYVEAGWGVALSNRISTDLNNPINSTPILGVGAIVPQSSTDLTVGLRFWHLSNANTNPPNKGQNQVLLTVGWRW